MSLCFWSRVVKSMEEKLNTSEKIPDLGATESAVTTAEPMYTSGPSDRSISGENNTRVLKKKTKLNGHYY